MVRSHFVRMVRYDIYYVIASTRARARSTREHARASEEHASTALLWYRERGARERFAIIRVIAARAIHLV